MQLISNHAIKYFISLFCLLFFLSCYYRRMGRLSNIPIEELNNRIDGLSISNGSIENWAKTFVATPQRIFQPNTIEDVEYIIEAAFRQQIRVKPVGVWHSPSDLSCSDEWMIRMHKLAGVINV